MANLQVKTTSPIGSEYVAIANSLLAGNIAVTSNVLRSMTLSLPNNDNFAVFNILIPPIDPSPLPDVTRTYRIDVRYKNSIVWKNIFKWRSDEVFNIFPLNDAMRTSPVICAEIRFSISSSSEDDDLVFPSIVDIEYIGDLSGVPITSPPTIERFTTSNSFVVGDRPQYMFSMPLKDVPSKIIQVSRVPGEDAVLEPLVYQGEISRHAFYVAPERRIDISGSYFYDPIDNAVIVAKTTPSGSLIMNSFDCIVEYVPGIGCYADAAIEAVQQGPVFDVDKEAINTIHPDDIVKLSQDDVIPWAVINSDELQGGYQYFAAEYKDVVAEEVLERNPDIKDPRLDPAYAGRGSRWIRIGSAPDSFPAEESDYRKYWMQEKSNGEIDIIDNIWVTKCRGYVRFFGPPNSIIPKGIRVIAPSKVKYRDPMTNDDILPNSTAASTLSPQIPNGGMKPAPLAIELSMTGDNAHPDTSSRKLAVFRPHVMVYLRERTRYLGSTNWKEVGDGYGESSEITGVPYWI